MPTRTWRRSSASTSSYHRRRRWTASGRRRRFALWDQEDGFFLRRPAPAARWAGVRVSGCARWSESSLCLPLTAVDARFRSRTPAIREELLGRLAHGRILRRSPGTAGQPVHWRPSDAGSQRPPHVGAPRRGHRLRRVLANDVLDPNEFLSPTTASARCRACTPSSLFTLDVHGRRRRRVAWNTCPASPTCGLVRRQLELARAGLVPGQLPACCAALPQMYRRYYGDDFTVELPDRLPASSAHLFEVAEEIRSATGVDLPSRRRRSPPRLRRAPSGSTTIRCGRITCSSTSTSTATPAPASAPASQTGWTGLVARIIQVLRVPPAPRTCSRPPSRATSSTAQRPRDEMTGWPDRPVIYELNTAAWLYDVGKRAGHDVRRWRTVPAGGVGPRHPGGASTRCG